MEAKYKPAKGSDWRVRTDKQILIWWVFFGFILTINNSFGQVILDDPKELRDVDVVEHLGEFIPLDLTFVDDLKDTVQLGDYFQEDQPVILILHYSNCPMLCSLVLDGASKAVSQLAWKAGKKFQMLSVSIDPRDTPVDAHEYQQRYLKMLPDGTTEDGWRFLVGDDKNIKSLADAVGFKYYYVEDKDQFAHPAILFVLTPEGKISRYLYGLDHTEQDVRLALLEASDGKIGNTIDRLVLSCFHYDPDGEGYVILAGNVMRLGGIATVLILGIFLSLLWVRDKIRNREAK
ncbi:SCO family protein [bacterium]|nr:SCO family protein [bacterium]